MRPKWPAVGRRVAHWLGGSEIYAQKLVRKFQAEPERGRAERGRAAQEMTERTKLGPQERLGKYDRHLPSHGRNLVHHVSSRFLVRLPKRGKNPRCCYYPTDTQFFIEQCSLRPNDRVFLGRFARERRSPALCVYRAGGSGPVHGLVSSADISR